MTNISQSQIDALIEHANLARTHAYAPYSGHKVGSAVLDAAGNIHSGCNVEIVTLQQAVHAERAAIVAMACSGARQLRAVAVAGPYSGIPCAECRQVIWEFACADPDVVIISAPTDGDVEVLRLGDIYPSPYGPETKNIDPRDH